LILLILSTSGITALIDRLFDDAVGQVRYLVTFANQHEPADLLGKIAALQSQN
jgi:hypothetical protein